MNKKSLDNLTAEDWGNLFPVRISEYNPKWPSIFNAEREEIETTLCNVKDLRIEHFGSTAVPGLHAKDTIDILVEIPTSALFTQAIIDAMKAIGYHYFLQQGDEAEYMVFGKGYNLEGKKEQTFHVHMSDANHPIWDRLYFRDYLRQHPETAREYAELKLQLSKKFEKRRVDYRIAKTEFVTRITEKGKTAAIKMHKYTKEDILKALDENKWAIVFEKSGFGNRSGQAEIELNYFGNCLVQLDPAGVDGQFTCNAKYLERISNKEFEKVEGGFELVSKEASTIKVGEEVVAIDHTLQNYRVKGIEIQTFDNPDELIDYPSLVRYLDETHPEIFRATDAELRTCIPMDLPFILSIDKWHHRSYNEFFGDKPSTYETFQLIADVLVNKNAAHWQPTLEANNNWRNWPEAGSL